MSACVALKKELEEPSLDRNRVHQDVVEQAHDDSGDSGPAGRHSRRWAARPYDGGGGPQDRRARGRAGSWFVSLHVGNAAPSCTHASSQGRRHLLTGGADSPAGQIAQQAIAGSFRDAAAVRELAQHCDVVTMEIEHIDCTALEALEAEGASERVATCKPLWECER